MQGPSKPVARARQRSMIPSRRCIASARRGATAFARGPPARGVPARPDRRGCAGSPRPTRRASRRRESDRACDGVDAAGGQRLVTTGTPSAIASRILFCVPARDVERRDHQRRAAQVRAHVRHRAGDGDAGKLAEAPHAGEGSAPTIVSFDPGPARAQQRQRVGAEAEHAFLVRVSSPCVRRRRSCRRS